MYCNATKKSPKMATWLMVIERVPAEKGRTKKSLGSSMGLLLLSSQSTKATKAATPTTKPATTHQPVQPSAGPSMMANTTPEIPATDRTAPAGSRDACSGSLEVGTNAAVPVSARAASTTLRAKIEGQEKNSSKAPETRRLTNVPAPATPAHTPTAPLRSSGGNTLVTIESVIGMIVAAPTPETVLSAISAPGLSAKTAAAEAIPNTTNPTSSTSLRPWRSPKAPAGNNNPANTTA